MALIDNAIGAATKANCQSKKVCKHSKPYWTKELTTLSDKLRKALKVHSTRNTDNNLSVLQDAKHELEEARKLACQKFILDKTNTLNTAQSCKFWKEFNRLFKPPTDTQVEALVKDDGSVINDNAKLEEILFETFFKGKHIVDNQSSFDVQFFEDTNTLYKSIIDNEFTNANENKDKYQHSSALYNPISEQEVRSTIKDNKSAAGSFDNCKVHPLMLKHLDLYAIYALTRLFNLCLRNGKWLWNSSNIVFLKKESKDSYSKPGSYRPISISSYIGKLFEKIIVRRLDQYLLKVGILDANQEGFSKGRSTVRYLHRLTAGIKGDIRKRLTVLCLFVDLEKAFDSVWKKGLIVKLWKVGVHGCYLKTINSFLMNRTVCFLLNGYVGPVRKCLDFGLPQGVVLSPILFKFYVYDLDNVCQLYHHISFFKFADDGSAKVTGETLEECLYYMNLVLGSINDWTSRWRMVINCEQDRGHMFPLRHTPIGAKNFMLGNKTIQLTDHSKVFGIILDKNLTYKEYSLHVYNKLVYKWVNICRYCNRNWGLNQIVTIRLIRVLIFSSLFYWSIVWMNSGNMKAINSLWYKLSKSAVGPIFNVNSSLLEVILGTPPLEIQNRIIIVKHYLKCVTDQHDNHQDKHLSFILNELAARNSAVENHIWKVFKFLEWKIEIRS